MADIGVISIIHGSKTGVDVTSKHEGCSTTINHQNYGDITLTRMLDAKIIYTVTFNTGISDILTSSKNWI